MFRKTSGSKNVLFLYSFAEIWRMDEASTHNREETHKEIRQSGIKSWDPDDRPREKLLRQGTVVLTNAELLAILIGTGNREQTALGLARKLLTCIQQDLHALGKLSARELMRIKGLGEAKAAAIVAAFELGRRRQSGPWNKKMPILHSGDAAGFLQPRLADYLHEVFAVLFLNHGNYVIHFEIVSSGGLSATVADPRIILKKALEQGAAKLVLCHNHPSGNLAPSREDLRLTDKLCQAAMLLDMRILDHIIVSREGFVSFADEGWLHK
jgi:DNA repair protein RadC